MIVAIKKKNIIKAVALFCNNSCISIHAHHFGDVLFLADKTSLLFDNLQPVLVFFFKPSIVINCLFSSFKHKTTEKI